jgi:hypothetical protein
MTFCGFRPSVQSSQSALISHRYPLFRRLLPPEAQMVSANCAILVILHQPFLLLASHTCDDYLQFARLLREYRNNIAIFDTLIVSVADVIGFLLSKIQHRSP